MAGSVEQGQGGDTVTPTAPTVTPSPTPGHRVRDRRVALGLITVVAAFLYTWAIGRQSLEPYYQAAVLSMSRSWHDFFFGAFDPAGTITLDKLPGAFWVQALFVRVLGFHVWVIELPQVIEGVLTVLVLYRAVTRLAGGKAGLIAALVLALSPATVALNRGNIADTLMVLLLVLAADAVAFAIRDDARAGRTRTLVLAGVWVGLAFQAKMVEAWLVLPALVVPYALCGPGTTWRRVRQSGVLLVVAVAVSLVWMTVVSLLPAGGRPYVDGSQHDSLFEMVFLYNGFGRYTQQTPLQLLQTQASINVVGTGNGAPGIGRLLYADLGRDVGWLLPLAVVVAVWALIVRRRESRRDPLRAGFLLWGLWLVTLAATFSTVTLINAYYLGALTPAIAAIIGLAVPMLRPGAATRFVIAAAVVLTVGYDVFLIPANGTYASPWQWVVIIVVGVVAVGVALAAGTRERMFRVVVLAGLAAVLVAPTIAAAELALHAGGSFDTPFESAGELHSLEGQAPLRQGVARYLPTLYGGQAGAPDLAATQTSIVAAFFIDGSGEEVLPIGGLDGTSPSPTVAQLRADINAGVFHLVLASDQNDPRIAYIAGHCEKLNGTALAFYCKPGDGT